MKYFLLVFLSINANAGLFSDDFKWGYRVCFKSSNECLEVKAKFKKEKDCIDHLERHSHRCLAGSKLLEKQLDDPVCWKAESAAARAECIKL